MNSSPPAYPAHPGPTAGPFAVKRVGVAYVCLVFLGGLGAHHFYLRHAKRGAALLFGSLFGVLPLVLTAFQVFPGERANVLSYVAAAALAAWLVIDLVTLPFQVRAFNANQHDVAVSWREARS